MQVRQSTASRAACIRTSFSGATKTSVGTLVRVLSMVPAQAAVVRSMSGLKNIFLGYEWGSILTKIASPSFSLRRCLVGRPPSPCISAMINLIPSLAKVRAVALPIPAAPPVTRKCAGVQHINNCTACIPESPATINVSGPYPKTYV